MNPYIKLKNVCYTYPKSSFGLNDISLDLYKGEITAVVGSNGSGKTTLSKIMTGILKPSSGELYICGQNAVNLELYEFGQKIGYAFQNPDRQLFTSSVWEEICFPLRLKDTPVEEMEKKAEALLNQFRLTHKKAALPIRLSRGEKRRLVLAAILATEPMYLILDEPSTGLDRDNRKLFYDLLLHLCEQGLGIAVITHDLHFVNQYAKRTVTMHGGRILKNGS